MQSVSRIVTILAALGQHPDGIGVIQLSDKVDIPPSSLHRILQALAEHQLIWQYPATRKYSLGLGLLDLSLPLVENTAEQIRQRSRPLMVSLSEQTGETVYVSILAQDKVLSVDSVPPSDNHRMQINVPYGQIMPLHCAASAKAILAFLPEQDVRRMLKGHHFVRYTDATITDPTALIDHFGDIKQQGYAVCDEEAELGITAIAAPVLDRSGHAFASVGLCAPSRRLEGERQFEIASALREIADSVNYAYQTQTIMPV